MSSSHSGAPAFVATSSLARPTPILDSWIIRGENDFVATFGDLVEHDFANLRPIASLDNPIRAAVHGRKTYRHERRSLVTDRECCERHARLDSGHGVDHRRADVSVTEKRLNGADVVAGLQEMRREGMAEGVGRDVLGDSGGNGGAPDFLLNHRLVEVMATRLAVPAST
jgi:hypothetical protein